MINRTGFPRRLAVWALAAAVATASTGWPSSAAGQQQPKQSTVGKSGLEIIRLRYSTPEDIAALLARLYGQNPEIRIASDPRTNSLIVAGSESDRIAIKKTVETLDVETLPDKGGTQLRIFRLRNIPADGQALSAIQAMLGNRGSFAVDASRGVLLVSGDQRLLETTEAVLQALDRPVDKPAAKVMRVRIVWLGAGMELKNIPAAPAEFKEVVGELAKIGVKDPQLLSQLVVNALTNSMFETQGTASLPGFPSPTKLTAKGMLMDKPDGSLALQIAIEASQEMEGAAQGFPGGRGVRTNKPLCKIETTLDAPAGHMLVLGVTPSDALTSVFLVQFVAK